MFCSLIWAQRITDTCYGILALLQLTYYKNYLISQTPDIEKTVSFGWLRFLISGFVTLWLCVVLTLIEPSFFDSNLAGLTGNVENYLLFLLMNTMVFYGLKKFRNIFSKRRCNTVIFRQLIT